jgi:hypothetical protein
MLNSTQNSRHMIDSKKRMKILYKRLFFSYVKKYGLAISSLWLLNYAFNLHIPFLSVLFIVTLLLFVNLEYDLGLLSAEKLVYSDNINIKTKHGTFRIPNSLLLLAIPFIENIVSYIENTKKYNLLFKTSLYNSIQKNSKFVEKQEIILYTCNFCTKLILDIDIRAVIVKEEYLTFDIGFLSGLKYSVIVQDENGNILEKMPKYKIDCIKETISKNILNEDIDIFCYNNNTSVFDFLNSFFFVYWLVENYLLYAPSRRVLI